MNTFVGVYTAQKKLIQTIDLDHLSHLAHVRIVEDLYSRGAKGEALSDLLNTDFLLSNLDSALLQHSQYDFTYKFSIKSPKNISKQDTAEKLLLDLTIKAFKKNDQDRKSLRKYSYIAFVTRTVKLGTQQTTQENANGSQTTPTDATATTTKPQRKKNGG